MNPKDILGSAGDSIASLFGTKNKTAVVGRTHLTSAVRLPGGPFQFQFQLPKGRAYEIHVSRNLDIWEPLLSGKTSGEPVDCLDADASRFSKRFYRVLAEAVWSDNVVGYVSTTVPPGHSMIANPFQALSNAVSAILPGLPDGTMLNKFDTQLFRLSKNAVIHGKWRNPDETLVPGEGAILFNPSSEFTTINFTGEVVQGDMLMPIGAGFSIRSSRIPKPGRLHTDLGFPIREGDLVHLFDRDRQKYVIYEYDKKKWNSNPPVVSVGEAFWIGKATPGNWRQRLVIQ